MNLIKNKIESIVLLIIGYGFYLLSIDTHFATLIYKVFNYEKSYGYAQGLKHVSVIYSILFFTFAIISFFITNSGSSLLKEILGLIQGLFTKIKNYILYEIDNYDISQNKDLGWFLIIMFSGIIVRAYFLSQPMGYDESATFSLFINKGLSQLFNYLAPNNHVLYTIITKISSSIWGVSPTSLRLPAFFAGVGLIPLTYWVCRNLNISGLLASTVIALSPLLIHYSTNSRGYMLLCFITVCLILIGSSIVKKEPSLLNSFIISIVASLGMMTIPTMLYGIAGLFLWILVLYFLNGYSTRSIFNKFLLPTGFMTIIFTLFLYTPVILVTNGYEPILKNSYVDTLPWGTFLRDIPSYLLTVITKYLHHIPKAVVIILILWIIISSINVFKDRDYPILLLVPLTILGAFIIFVLKRALPFPRIWVYFIPIIAILADSGYSAILKKMPQRTRFLSSSFLIVFVAISSLFMITSNPIFPNNDNDAAEVIARYFKTRINDDDYVIAQLAIDWPLFYYFQYLDVPGRYGNMNSTDLEIRKKYIVVDRAVYSINDVTQENTIHIFEYENIDIFLVED